MSPDPTKAARYLQLLDEARCDGNWEAVPEWIRKVRKHAPDRSCLTLTAEAEHAVATTPRPSTASRPSTAASSTASGVSRFIPLLTEAIEQEQKYVEDAFQARICLSWTHWFLAEPGLAAQRVPRSLEEEYHMIVGTTKSSSEYTKTAALKGAYIKGTYLARANALGEAMETFNSVLPIFTNIPSTSMNKKELRIWVELYLTGFCLTSSQAIKSKLSSILETEALSAFRAWAGFWGDHKAGLVGGRLPQADVSRRHVWLEYYHMMSELLQQGLPYPTTPLIATYPDAATRQQQKAELIRVEAKYEALLLNEVRFPEAEASNHEVEAFVELVMQNWRILCSDGWQESKEGDSDSEAISRGVLEILYRAASKTFHSTPILRHLFTVHLSLGEYDLALKAFDTYLDLVKKGKERVQKTGEPESTLDNDENVLITASKCMIALCKYGPEQGAEKAHQLALQFEDWLEKHFPTEEAGTHQHPTPQAPSDPVSPSVLALAWRSIGIAHAQWSRATFEAVTRTDIQLRAIRCFRKALRPEYKNATNVETLFALGVVLAERRELTAAIEVVKTGLQPPKPGKLANSQETRYTRERSVVPLWHLMSLLVSARQEFMTAARFCEGAFEQFDPVHLFGEAYLDGGYRSEHTNESEKPLPTGVGIVDEMDDFEKENLLEIKITQLTLVEVLEGPEIAVNACNDLLSLYGRLFGGDPQKNNPFFITPKSESTMPPKSSAGTVKSTKGSIFGRSRSLKHSQKDSDVSEKTLGLARPDTTQTGAGTISRAPTIQVTRENGTLKEHKSHEKLRKRSESLHKKEAEHGRDRSKSRSASRAPSIANQPPVSSPTAVDGEKYFTPPATPGQREAILGENTLATQIHNPVSEDVTSPKESKAIASSNGVSHELSMPWNPVELKARLPKAKETHRRSGTLVKVWLLIAGFYRRAALYDDAKAAIEEAQKLVKGLEAGMLQVSATDATVAHAGWGGGRSVNELWGDVYAERGQLALAEEAPWVALQHFESALIRFVDHPSAIVGISTLLLDIYTEVLTPPPSIPSLILPASLDTFNSPPTANTLSVTTVLQNQDRVTTLVSEGPLGLSSPPTNGLVNGLINTTRPTTSSSQPSTSSLEPPHKATSTSLLDRLAARDRAYALLSGLTKLGTGWNSSEAWFALSRAHEESGQVDKAKEVLWWCVELEDARSVRDWRSASVGGYVL
ncbi:hypothetical protein F5884DRAFT_894548 [Xylogone sp. PMI_703]|nr:hypothetical protein F5884DRAFT_894548 [Xylogone sp. PMI_703]